MILDLSSTSVYLFIGIIFLLLFMLGHLIERIKVPWIFAALILGALFGIDKTFAPLIAAPEFMLLSNLGQYFLLFIIGFEVNFKKMREQGPFILRATGFIIISQTLITAWLLNALFGLSWGWAIVVGLNFVTIGEAVLVPILDRFGLMKTRLGQTILGIGSLDDVAEVALLAVVVTFVGSGAQVSLSVVIIAIGILIALALALSKIKNDAHRFGFSNLDYLFLFTLFILFIFIGIGEIAQAGTLGALLAGLALGNFIPPKRLETITSEISSLCYGFFAPIFLFWVGTTLDLGTLVANPLPILIICGVTTVTTIIAAMLISWRQLDLKESVLLGLASSVRFSSSTIVFNLLFLKGIIDTELYTTLVLATIVVTFIIPMLFSGLVSVWGIGKEKPAEAFE